MFYSNVQSGFPKQKPRIYCEERKKIQGYRLTSLGRWKGSTITSGFCGYVGLGELAHKVDKIYSNLSGSGKTLVLCDNYGQAGAINYCVKSKIRALSFNGDYINWFEFNQPYVNLIRVKEFREKGNELLETSPYFHNSLIADSIENKFAREYGTTIFVFTKAKVNVDEKLKQEIEEGKELLINCSPSAKEGSLGAVVT